MGLERYTNTYTDVDSNIFDADDLVEEFNRVAEYINAWAASIESIGTVSVYEQYITTESNVVTGSPSNSVVQQVVVNQELESIIVNFTERQEGDPFRVYMVLRFENKDTTFTVSGPSGQTHAFSVNKGSYRPCQTQTDGFYTAVVIATYGDAHGVFINVFADNDEIVDVENDDIQTVVAQ